MLKYKICYRSHCPKNTENRNECDDFNVWIICRRCLTSKPLDEKQMKELQEKVEKIKEKKT